MKKDKPVITSGERFHRTTITIPLSLKDRMTKAEVLAAREDSIINWSRCACLAFEKLCETIEKDYS